MLKHGLMPPSGALEKNNFNTHSKTGERQDVRGMSCLF